MEKAKTAVENEIKFLYHYQPLNFEYIERILKSKTIYCSNPERFNDPWDWKPWYDVSVLDDPIEFKRAKDFVIEKYRGGSSAPINLQEEMIERLGERVSVG